MADSATWRRMGGGSTVDRAERGGGGRWGRVASRAAQRAVALWVRGGSSLLRRTRARRSEARAQARCARCGGCKARASRGWGGPGRVARAAAAATRSGEAMQSEGRERRGVECTCTFLARWRSTGAAHIGLNDGESVRVAAVRELSDFELGLGLSAAIGRGRLLCIPSPIGRTGRAVVV